MMNKLSKREKTMLYILGLILIIGGGIYFLVPPMLDNYTLSQEEAAQAEEQRMLTEMQVAQLPALEEQIAQNRREAAMYSARLSPAVRNEDLDKMITGMLLEHGLTPSSLAMTDTTQQPVPAFGADAEEGAATAEAAPAETTTDTSQTGDAAAETQAAPVEATVYTNDITVVVRGSVDNVVSFVDYISTQDGIYVTSCSFIGQSSETGDAEGEAAQTETEGAEAFSINLVVYMKEV